MARYETSKPSSDFSPPPRGLGTWTSIAAIDLAAPIILGLFVRNDLGSSPTTSTPLATATTPGPTAAR